MKCNLLGVRIQKGPLTLFARPQNAPIMNTDPGVRNTSF